MISDLSFEKEVNNHLHNNLQNNYKFITKINIDRKIKAIERESIMCEHQRKLSQKLLQIGWLYKYHFSFKKLFKKIKNPKEKRRHYATTFLSPFLRYVYKYLFIKF